jgi:biotin-dependent carboxylase-like uncharacterized protein
MALGVVDAGLLTTLQDAGRLGYERSGVPVAGAMDWFALRAANLLVGNPPGAAALEFLSAAPPTITSSAEVLLAGAGAGFALFVDDVPIPAWMAFRVRPGQTVHIRPLPGPGCWGILAAAGGIATPPVLGSHSTYLRSALGGLDGRALRPGDWLPLGSPPLDWPRLAGSRIKPEVIPGYAAQATLEVILGPQQAAFTPAAIETLLSAAFTVSAASDRMGYRLEGSRLDHTHGADILSEGIAAGSIQVPGSGQPLLLLSDRQTTGGYAKIATVISADLPLAVQCQPGSGQIRFRAVEVAHAQARLRQQVAGLQNGIETEDLESGEAAWI